MKLLISPEQIQEKLAFVAREIDHFYQSKDLVILMVLKGSLCLVADLIRLLTIPFELEAIQCASYGQRGELRGQVRLFGLERLQIHNRDVLVVDDIFDSGATLEEIFKALKPKCPRSLKSLVLLSREKKPMRDVYPDWSLFELSDPFVIGYGLDYKEQYRGLKGIFINPK